MIFLTWRDIEERRACGYDERHLKSGPSQECLKLAAKITEQIEEAFSNVRLNNGVGLFEAQAIDDYESAEVRGSKRALDEKEDWRRIESKHLNECSGSLSFFDPEGMRFHLPAFMCCDLRGEYRMGLEFTLSMMDDLRRGQFSMLSSPQKQATAAYLEFLVEDLDTSKNCVPAIEKDLVEFWLS